MKTNEKRTCWLSFQNKAKDPLDLPEIPPWVPSFLTLGADDFGFLGAEDTLDPINQFVTPDIFEGNGWPGPFRRSAFLVGCRSVKQLRMGDLENIVIYHFLNGDLEKTVPEVKVKE